MLRKFVFIGLLCGGLSACADVQVANDSTNDFGKYTQLDRGETTKTQVYALFGQPSDVRYIGAVKSEWDFVSLRMRTAGATYVPIVGLFAGGARQDIRVATFQFDNKGVYQSVETIEHSVYENQWVMLARAGNSLNSPVFERVKREMQLLNLPYDEKTVIPPELYNSPKN